MVSHVLASSDIKGCQRLKVVACRHEEFHDHLAYCLLFRVTEPFSLPVPKHRPTELTGHCITEKVSRHKDTKWSVFLLSISQHFAKTKTTLFLLFFFSILFLRRCQLTYLLFLYSPEILNLALVPPVSSVHLRLQCPYPQEEIIDSPLHYCYGMCHRAFGEVQLS